MFKLRRTWLLPLVVLTAFSLATRPASAATPEQVKKAIEDAQKYFFATQKPDGSWEQGPAVAGQHYGGWTALATYALLASGTDPQDKRLQKAITWLANAKIESIYVIGIRAQCWHFLLKNKAPGFQKTLKAAVKQDYDLLLTTANAAPKPMIGRFPYTTVKGDASHHNSTSQYGVLGLWGCALAGQEIPNNLWLAIENAWFNCQGQDGGWTYQSVVPDAKMPARDTMTAAGVATLFVTQDALNGNAGISCKGNVFNPHIEAGLAWLDKNFAALQWGNGYLLYGIERIGVASGRKYFGKNDWYAVGSDVLVKGQANGVFPGGFGAVPDTAFGVVFLSRGSAPVAFNKLQYSTVNQKGKDKGKSIPGNWVERPRDVANMTNWVGEQLESDLNWQIVNLDVGAEDLHDAPVLFVSGDQAVNFSAEDEQKLQRFIEGGGLIWGQADCAKPAFGKWFQQFGQKMFPAYEFRELPPDHPLYKMLFSQQKWKIKPKIMGLSNGVRELMLIMPDEDPGKWFQTRSSSTKKEYFEIAADIFLYATDKQGLKRKGETYIVKKDPAQQPQRTVKVARLKYPGGNWDPEPGGWRRIDAYMHNKQRTDLAVQTVELAKGVGVAAGNAGGAGAGNAGGVPPGGDNENEPADAPKTPVKKGPVTPKRTSTTPTAAPPRAADAGASAIRFFQAAPAPAPAGQPAPAPVPAGQPAPAPAPAGQPAPAPAPAGQPAPAPAGQPAPPAQPVPAPAPAPAAPAPAPAPGAPAPAVPPAAPAANWQPPMLPPPTALDGGPLKGFTVAHLTGTTKLNLSAQARQDIKQFVSTGGTLIVDASGGSVTFADSAEAELATIFGGNAKADLKVFLPETSDVYKLWRSPISAFDYRRFAKDQKIPKAKVPHIAGLKVNGRLAVFYSREDLSGGLVGQQVGGVYGYTPELATELVNNIILYAAGELKDKPLPPAPPAPAGQPAPAQPAPAQPVPAGQPAPAQPAPAQPAPAQPAPVAPPAAAPAPVAPPAAAPAPAPAAPAGQAAPAPAPAAK